MYVCICNAVTESAIKEALDNGADKLRDLQNDLNVGTQCGSCCACARAMITAHQSEKSPKTTYPVNQVAIISI